jgi:cytochrome c oxidase subunit 2
MLYYYSACDAPIENLNLGFQDPASPQMEGLIGLHSDIWASMMFIAGFVTFVLVTIIKSKFTRSFKLNHNNLIEVIWTTVPAMLLCVIATPSFTLLYGLDEIVLPNLTLKAIGRQWYWSYEYGDFNLVFDSNLLPDDELSQGQLRLLEVDNRLVVPVNQPIRLLTSAGDVIHSFAVPSLGLKLDAIPG